MKLTENEMNWLVELDMCAPDTSRTRIVNSLLKKKLIKKTKDGYDFTIKGDNACDKAHDFFR